MPYKMVWSAIFRQHEAEYVAPEVVATHRFRGTGVELQIVRKYRNDLAEHPLSSGTVVLKHAAGVTVCGIINVPQADPAAAKRLVNELARAVLASRQGRALKIPARNAIVWRNLYQSTPPRVNAAA